MLKRESEISDSDGDLMGDEIRSSRSITLARLRVEVCISRLRRVDIGD